MRRSLEESHVFIEKKDILSLPEDTLFIILSNLDLIGLFVFQFVSKHSKHIFDIFNEGNNNFVYLNRNVLYSAVKKNSCNLMDWLQKCQYLTFLSGNTDNALLCRMAALERSLEILKWARDKGHAWDGYVCANSVFNNDFEMLKWAKDNGCPWNNACIVSAAPRGNLELVKWLIQNKCPWHIDFCKNAIKYGHFELLKWAIENGYPWSAEDNENIIKDILSKGYIDKCHLEIAKLILELESQKNFY